MNSLFLKDIVIIDDKKYLITASNNYFDGTKYEIRITPITDDFIDGISSSEDFMNSYKREVASKKKAIKIYESIINDKNVLLNIIKEG
jgi:two-component SAPR family response regulator